MGPSSAQMGRNPKLHRCGRNWQQLGRHWRRLAHPPQEGGEGAGGVTDEAKDPESELMEVLRTRTRMKVTVSAWSRTARTRCLLVVAIDAQTCRSWPLNFVRPRRPYRGRERKQSLTEQRLARSSRCSGPSWPRRRRISPKPGPAWGPPGSTETMPRHALP